MSAGQAGTVKFLLHHHANPNLKDHRDEAPLHAAVRTGNLEVVEVFQILIDFNQVFNRPFYRYGGQIEFTTGADLGKILTDFFHERQRRKFLGGIQGLAPH